MNHKRKLTPGDLVEVVCLVLVGAGAWVAWGFGLALVIVGSIGLAVALLARRAPRPQPKREGTA